MNKERIVRLLSPLYLLLGVAALGVHQWLYASYVEDGVSGLLPDGTLPEILLWVLTACAVLGAFLLTRRTGLGTGNQRLAALGDILFALGAASLLLESVKGPAVLVAINRAFCVVTGLSMAASALLRLGGKKPPFLLQVCPCVLCVLQLMEYYQRFSEVPQLMRYVLGLGAVLFLTLSAYHRMARAAALPDKPHHHAFGLLAIYFCAAAVSQGAYIPFFTTAALWEALEMARLCPDNAD